MKAIWVLGAALATSALSASALGQVSIGVTIGTPPPPIRYEVAPPPPPEVGYVWVQGYWVPNGGRYVWSPGRWTRPPYEGAGWHAAQWEHGDHGYHYHEGYWEHHEVRDHRDRDHDDDHHGNGHAYGHEKHDEKHDHD